MKGFLKRILNKMGYDVSSIEKQYPDIDNDVTFTKIFSQCKNYSMTSKERMYSLYKSIEFVEKNNIEGDIVECGVWQGGSIMLCALSLIEFGNTSRKIYLYDTFEGMPKPADESNIDLKGRKAIEIYKKSDVNAYSALETTMKNVYSTNYPTENIKFIKGMVEETIPRVISDKIAILRLDTDWFESTYHELLFLFPKLSTNGILIIDDYGHWQGAKEVC